MPPYTADSSLLLTAYLRQIEPFDEKGEGGIPLTNIVEAAARLDSSHRHLYDIHIMPMGFYDLYKIKEEAAKAQDWEHPDEYEKKVLTINEEISNKLDEFCKARD